MHGRMRVMDADRIAFALDLVADHFDQAKPARMLRGIALSTKGPNAHGDGFNVGGMIELDGATPLLLDHDPLRPLGVLRSLSPRGDALHVEAEITNTDRQFWTAQAWPRIASGEWVALSIGAARVGPRIGATFHKWALTEVSIVSVGADAHARVVEVYEMDRVLHLEKSSMKRVLWRERKASR